MDCAKVNGTILPLAHCTAPPTNPTNPSAPQNLAITRLPGLLFFDWDRPIVIPRETRYQIWRAPGSLAVANSGELVWQGNDDQAFVSAQPTSPYWYWLNAIANSYVGPYTNTFGILAVAGWPADNTLSAARGVSDAELIDATSNYWGWAPGVWSLSQVGGTFGGVAICTGTATVLAHRLTPAYESNVSAYGAKFPVYFGQLVTVVARYRRTSAVAGSGGVHIWQFGDVGTPGTIQTMLGNSPVFDFLWTNTLNVNEWHTKVWTYFISNSITRLAPPYLERANNELTSGTIEVDMLDCRVL